MPIHFASSHAADFYKLAGSVDTSPNAAFDPDYVKQTLVANAGAPCWRQVIPSSVQTDFYWQAKTIMSSVAGGGGRTLVNFISTVASVQTPYVRIAPTSSDFLGLQYWNGSAWTTIGTPLGVASSTLYTLTVRIKVHATVGELSFWINNAPIGSLTGDTSALGFISDVEIWNQTGSTGAGGPHEWAEFLVTTSEHPYLMKVKTHVLEAASNYGNSDWTGAYTDVDEPDPSASDIISSAVAGDVSTFQADDLPALGALVVRAVQVSAVARCGATGPQNIQLTLHASGVDQLSTTKALTTGFQTVFHVYETNSVTGAEFTKSEIDASEPGVTSVT